MNLLTEDEIEQIALEVLQDELQYETRFGPGLIDGDTPERTHAEAVLATRLKQAIHRINPAIPTEARDEAFKK